MYDQSALRTLDYHRSMLADKERTRRLEQAILERVKPGMSSSILAAALAS